MGKLKLSVPYQSLEPIELGEVTIDIDDAEIEIEYGDDVVKDVIYDYLKHNDFVSIIEERLFSDDSRLADTIRRVLMNQVVNEDGLVDFQKSLTDDENVVTAMIQQLQQNDSLLALVIESLPQYYVYCTKVGVEQEQASRVRDLFRSNAQLVLDKLKEQGNNPFENLAKIVGDQTE